VEERSVNLSGIWNNLPDLLRSQQTGSPAPAASSVTSNGAASANSQAIVPNGGKTDQADLSSSGLAAAQSAQQSGTSDVRMEKVDSVRAAINGGTYQVSAQDVAGKIIQNLLG
jgi:negative regulator of flagellin synthesis FlgM